MPIFVVGALLAILQQVTGINTIIYYAPTIFKLAGFKTSSSILVTALVGIVNVFFTLLSLPLIDKLGRRSLLFIGVSGMCASLMILGFAFQQAQMTNAMRYLCLTSMMLYIACFAISLGPMVFVILSEIFPLKLRGLGMSLAMGCNWCANMIVALTFLSLVHSLGATNTFYLYALVSILCLFFIYLFIPETKGVSLEEIESRIHLGVATRYLGHALQDEPPSMKERKLAKQ